MGTKNPAPFGRIASIVIRGIVAGTTVGMDHFGFVSQEIGSTKINGVKIPLSPGSSTDTNATDTRFIRDVTAYEVA